MPQVDHRPGPSPHDPRDTERLFREAHIARRNKFSAQLVAEASEIFSRRLGRAVSDGEARALLGDLTDYYRLAVDRHRSASPIHRPAGKKSNEKN